MKRYFLVPLLLLASAAIANAQIGAAPATDVLGAHLNYGRGCAACHAPHSGAWGNGANKSKDTTSGDSILWGQDVGSLYNKTITVAGNRVEVLPASMTATTPDVTGLLTCLSCHDGNYAQGAMMKNAVYETLPPTYGGVQRIPPCSETMATPRRLSQQPPGGPQCHGKLRRPLQLGLHRDQWRNQR